MRKIIFVVGTLDSGGIERSVTEWSLYLKQHTTWVPVIVCILRKKGIFLQTLEAAGIEVFECRISNTSIFRPFSARLADLVRQHKPDVVHSQVAFSLLWQTMGFKLGGAKKVIFTQQNEYQNWNSFLPKMRLRTYFTLARPFIDAYTCVSEKVRKNLSALLGVSSDKFSVIYNSVNTDIFFPQPELRPEARKRMELKSDEFCMGVVANVSAQKGHPYIIEACALLKKETTKNFKLVLIGNGDFEPIRKLAANFNVSEKVQFMGRRDDVNVLLQGMDCFVLPSLWEGLPLALIEAMACGLPAIASEVSGNTEVIENGKTGLLFPAANAVELKNCIKRLLENPTDAQALAAKGRELVMNKFHLPKAMAQYIALYE